MMQMKETIEILTQRHRLLFDDHIKANVYTESLLKLIYNSGQYNVRPQQMKQ